MLYRRNQLIKSTPLRTHSWEGAELGLNWGLSGSNKNKRGRGTAAARHLCSGPGQVPGSFRWLGANVAVVVSAPWDRGAEEGLEKNQQKDNWSCCRAGLGLQEVGHDLCMTPW